MKTIVLLYKITIILSLLNLSSSLVHGQFTKEDWDNLHWTMERSGATFAVGENPATLRPLEHLCGLRPPKQTEKIFQPSESSLETRSLPSKFDWREISGCPPVRDQGNCGACWAFATIAPLESNILNKDGQNINLSEQWLISCNKDNWDCIGGWWAYKYIVDPGAVLESDCLYQGIVTPCGGPYSYPYRIKSWNFVHTEFAIAPTDKIKQAILDYGPVSSAISVGNAFRAYTGGIFGQTSDAPTDVNHGVSIVGWDNSMEGGCWIIRNSWGTGWGIGGYMYIKYGTSNVGYSANYVIYESGVDFASFFIDDDPNGMSRGNGNGLAEPGETIEMGLALKNNTEYALSDIQAQISSDSMYLNYITSDTATFGNIDPYEEKQSSQKYLFTLSEQIPQGTNIKFNITISNPTNQFHTHFIMPIQSDPIMIISPSSLNAVIFTHDTVEKTITMKNIGYNPLNFNCGATDTTSNRVKTVKSLETPSHLGGPDDFGYMWMDSDTIDGPAYKWIEIKQIGVPLLLDDDDHAVVTLPFSFPFYGDPKDTMFISSNGYLTFGEEGDSYSYREIPFPTEPNDFIAPFWCDLNPDAGAHGNIFYYHDIAKHHIIIEWDGVTHNDFNNPETFQTILFEDGRILFQYKTMSLANKCTVGIENSSGDDGLEISFQKDYLHDGLAILIAHNAPWLTFHPQSGSIEPNDITQIKVAFDGSSLTTGTHTARLFFNSNDPKCPYSIPVNVLMADKDPYIEHSPYPDTYDKAGPYRIVAKILSKAPLDESKLMLSWRTSDKEAFTSIPLNLFSENTYEAYIPGYPSGTDIEYYLFAENTNGVSAALPQNAPEMTFKFSIMNRAIMNIIGSFPITPSFPPNERNTLFNVFTIRNDGTIPLVYEIAQSSQIPWLIINPPSGTLEYGNSRRTSLVIDTKDILPGNYFVDLLITSNDPINPQITLPVELTVNDQIPNRKWTFMVYMDGDNDLERHAIKDFLEITNASLNANVAVSIQMDRIKGFDTQFGDWTICHRFAAQRGMSPIESVAVPDWGDGSSGREVNMGDPKTLADFISWSAENFPSPHYALILWNHGGGWRRESVPILRDICKDITSNDSLSTKEMGDALDALGGKFDIIAMDACYMGMLEVAYEIRNKGSIMIASEGVVPLEGLPYTDILDDLCTSPTLSAEEQAKNIILRYSQKYRGVSFLSACNLDKVENLAQAIGAFATSAISDPGFFPSIAHARRMVTSHNALDETCDIKDFADTLYSACKNPLAKDSALAIKTALENAIVSSYSASCYPAYGLSLYFPNPSTSKNIDTAYSCKNIQFACDTTWDDLLPLILGSDTNPPTIQHTPLKDTLDTSGPYQIEAIISDSSAITNVNLYWRKGFDSFEKIPMSFVSNLYSTSFGNGGGFGDQFSYRIEAIDSSGNIGYFPGPTEERFWRFDIAEPLQGLWESFDAGNMDLTYTRMTFIPDSSSPQRYRICSEKISDWSIDPYDGQQIQMFDNDFTKIEITHNRVFLYGNPYSTLFIGSNGYITFDEGDCDNSPTIMKNYQLPRIALFYSNLTSYSEGMITWEQMNDRIVVSYIGVNNNYMQAELGYEGIIRLTWLSMDQRKGFIGLSNGQGIPTGDMTDFSIIQTCPQLTAPEAEFETLPDFAGGYYPIAFTIRDAQSYPCSILAEFSTDGGVQWQTASSTPQNRCYPLFTPTPGGNRFIFVWNTFEDLGSGAYQDATLKITPYNMLMRGLPADTPTFSIKNPTRTELLDHILSRKLSGIEETTKLDVNHDGMIAISDILFLINNGL